MWGGATFDVALRFLHECETALLPLTFQTYTDTFKCQSQTCIMLHFGAFRPRYAAALGLCIHRDPKHEK